MEIEEWSAWVEQASAALFFVGWHHGEIMEVCVSLPMNYEYAVADASALSLGSLAEAQC